MTAIPCVWLTPLRLSFRHKLDEAMLTDPWDSMKHADLGGCSAPLGSSQTLYLPQRFTAPWLKRQPPEHEIGRKGSEKT